MDNLINNIERFPQGHPVRVYIEENILIKQLFEEIFKVDAKEDFQLFFNLFNQISQVEKHFSRKENQLFPYLEKYGWTSPSQGMWAFHDQIRAEIKIVRKKIEDKDFENILNDLIVVFNSLSQLMLVKKIDFYQEQWNY